MIRNYYTLEDMIKKVYEWPEDVDLGVPVKTDNITYFSLVVENIMSGNYPTIVSSDEANILWCTYIAPVNKDQFVGYVNKFNFDEPTDEEQLHVYQIWMRHYLSVFNATYDKYKYLIDTLNTEKTHLMDEIKSTTFNKFNDTPQGSGDFSGDNHATTVNISKTSVEGGTKMQRLAEIETSLKNYYSKWADEFGGLFINE